MDTSENVCPFQHVMELENENVALRKIMAEKSAVDSPT